jgi:hypothetical protein
MRTKLEAAVYGVLDSDGGGRWKSRLQAHVKESIVKRARSLLGSPPLAVPAEWDSLDDIDYRTATVGTVDECAAEVTRKLFSDDTAFAEFKAAVEGVGLGLSRAKLANALRPELVDLIDPTTIRAYAEAVTPESVWGDLANLIAAEIYAAESKSPPQSEADCLHWSLLAAFFQVTKIPEAGRLGKTLRDCLSVGRFNVRGYLVRNVERTSVMGIVDPTLSHVAYAPVVLNPAHSAASQLLSSVAEESQKIPASHGFAITTIGEQIKADPPTISPEDAKKGITAEMALNSRVFRYQQYEYSALSLSAIAATEFCLRCATEASPGLKLDPRFAGQIEIAAALPLTDTLKMDLQTLFGSTGPNFRNRSLHGGFLEIESRRTEMTMYSGFAAGIGVPMLNLDTDPYIPKNAAAIALKVLSKLDSQLAPQGLVHPGATKWTTDICLSPADLAFATGLCQPMVEMLSSDTKRRTIVGFVREAFPCLSVPVQLGLIGWSNPKPGASPIQLFALLAVMFEPAMRLVAHAAGFPIFRRGSSAGVRVTRYLMLDDQGFLATPFLDWIEAGLPASEKADARKTITVGVCCRDAFAHGAITTFDELTRKAYGAVMAKSIYLLVTAAINHKL